MNGCAPAPLRASRLSTFVETAPPGCLGCGSSLIGRRDRETATFIIFSCPCGRERRVKR